MILSAIILIVSSFLVSTVPVGHETVTGSLSMRILREAGYLGTKGGHKALVKKAHSSAVEYARTAESLFPSASSSTTSASAASVEVMKPIDIIHEEHSCFDNMYPDETLLKKSLQDCIHRFSEPSRSLSENIPSTPMLSFRKDPLGHPSVRPSFSTPSLADPVYDQAYEKFGIRKSQSYTALSETSSSLKNSRSANSLFSSLAKPNYAAIKRISSGAFSSSSPFSSDT